MDEALPGMGREINQYECWQCVHMTVKCPVPAIQGKPWEYCRHYKKWMPVMKWGETRPAKACRFWEEYERNTEQQGAVE